MITCFIADYAHASPAGSCEHRSPETAQLQSALRDGQNLMMEGKAAMDKYDWQAANRSLLRGLEVVGDSYLSDGMLDDTGQHLVLADIEARRGLAGRAANIRLDILGNRLDLAKKKLAIECKMN